MRNVSAAALLLIASTLPAMADDNAYSGPFFMCPDAHGEEQKALFRIIDITRMPMRIEGMGPLRIDGFGASIAASRGPINIQSESGKDPIEEAYEKLAGIAGTMSADEGRQLAAVCFATTPPPAEDIDGPFVFMPGYLIKSSADVLQPMDTIQVPAQTYLVLSYQGTLDDIGNMRFTMTEEFWPKVAPYLGIERADGPNVMIWPEGARGDEPEQTLEFWTPIKPYVVSPR